jgi:hypothetical protein
MGSISLLSFTKTITAYYRYFIIALLVIALIWLSSSFLPEGIDLVVAFYPAAQSLINGNSPYDYIFNPPWVLIPFIPLAFLPIEIARGIWFLFSLFMFAYVAYRLKASPLTMAFFLISPPVMKSLMDGNVDWMPLLGFILPPQIGLFFVAIKPQIGIGVAIFWFVQQWRTGGIKSVIKTFLPCSVAFLLSMLVFGYWPSKWDEMMINAQTYNHSFWPVSIPVGLAFLVSAIRKKDMRFAMGIGPCLSPYSLLNTWSGAFLALSRNQYEMIAAVIGLWFVVFLRSL